MLVVLEEPTPKRTEPNLPKSNEVARTPPLSPGKGPKKKTEDVQSSSLEKNLRSGTKK